MHQNRPLSILKKKCGLTLFVLTLLGIQSCTKTILKKSPTNENQVIEFAHQPFKYWPSYYPGITHHAFTSFDRSGGNMDGFEGSYATLYERQHRGTNEYIIADSCGPGILRSLWFTGSEEGGKGLKLGKIRFYIDDLETPFLETTAEELFIQQKKPFIYPLTTHPKQSTGGYVSWISLPFKKKLLITTTHPPNFYSAYIDRFPDSIPIKRPATFSKKTGFAELIKKQITSNQWKEIPLHAELQGSKRIEAIRFTPTKETFAYLANTFIEISWDKNTPTSASFRLPFFAFFGSALNRAVEINSAAFYYKKDQSFINKLPMPYWKSASIKIAGKARGKLEVILSNKKFDKQKCGYLLARYQDTISRPDEDILYPELFGCGKVVATLLGVVPKTKNEKRWWEGDLRIYFDGLQTPNIHGTGIEDDHFGGWSNTFFSRPFSMAMHGEPYAKLIEKQELQHNAIVSLYRHYPGLFYYSSFRAGHEHGNENSVDATYRSVIFYYHYPQVALNFADKIVFDSKRSRKEHRYHVKGQTRFRSIWSSFEGEGYREKSKKVALHHHEPLRFSLATPQKNNGCFLTRTFDQRYGKQKAHVNINHSRIATFYYAGSNNISRFRQMRIFISPKNTKHKSRLDITIKPSSKKFNAISYALHCIIAKK